MPSLLRVEGALECTIVSRVNRFVVLVEAGGSSEKAHINNTGRLLGLLAPGRRGYCLRRDAGRTRYRLFAVEDVGGEAALIDTQLQMRSFEHALGRGLIPWLRGCSIARRAPRVWGSVLDYLLDCGRPVYAELKSAVLRLEGDLAAYPDPASNRGRRHVEVLARLAEEGVGAVLVFVAAMPRVKGFTLNVEADPILPSLVRQAELKGVLVKALSMHYSPASSEVVLGNPDLPVHV
ncbi:MAG: DNA/RNA nuclease SfsA [Thermoproteota archaeon]